MKQITLKRHKKMQLLCGAARKRDCEGGALAVQWGKETIKSSLSPNVE